MRYCGQSLGHPVPRGSYRRQPSVVPPGDPWHIVRAKARPSLRLTPFSALSSEMTSRAIAFLAVLFLAAPAVAQQDTIWLTDGTKKQRVRVTAFDFLKIEFRSGSNLETLPREKVLRFVPGQRALDRYFNKARKYEADEEFGDAFTSWIGAAEKLLTNARLRVFAQYAYWRAFDIARSHGKPEDERECLDGLEKKVTNSGYWPDIWRFRLGLVRNVAAAQKARKPREKYQARVEQFSKWVEDNNLSERYSIEAKLFKLDAKTLLAQVSAKQRQDQLNKLLSEVEGVYPDLATVINLEFAYAVLAGTKHEDARKLFTTIVNDKAANSDTKARAYLGRGHAWMSKPGRTSDDARRALLDYMRVSTLFPKSDAEIVGEALFKAMDAYEAWNGPEKKANIRRIKSRLKLRYADSTWAKKR